jgi:drug/metabolite transporter (DMT)-like permease
MPLRHDLRRGALLMVLACALFACISAMFKLLSADLSFLALMFFRSACALPVVTAIAIRRGGSAGTVLRTRRLGGHVLRAVTGTSAMGCGIFALTVLPLADQTALTSTTPLFVTLLSIPLLGEKVGLHRWGAVLAGFAGILVIALGQGAFAGGFGSLAGIGVLAAMAHGIFSAATTLLVRQLSATENSSTITLWQSILMTGLTALPLPFVWVTPSATQLLVLLAIGAVGGIAQVLLTEAYASAQVSALGPYTYTTLLWSVLLGWLVFAEPPTASMLAGAALIVVASLYILHREMVRARSPR